MKKGDKFIDYYAEPIMHELLSEKGFDRVKGDQMGMCATVINSLALSSAYSPMLASSPSNGMISQEAVTQSGRLVSSKALP